MCLADVDDDDGVSITGSSDLLWSTSSVIVFNIISQLKNNLCYGRRYWLTNVALINLLLIACLCASASAAVRRHCVDALCRLRSSDGDSVTENVKAPARLFGADGRALDECRACQQCTDNGYSVCAMPKRFERSLGKFLWSRSCECTHAVPRNCELVPPQRNPQPELTADGRMLYHFCYLSALRKPDVLTLHAENTREMVLVTLEQFWLDDYWQALRPENLTLHYEFVVNDFSHCHGKLKHLSKADVNQLLSADEKAKLERKIPTSSSLSSNASLTGGNANSTGGAATPAESFLCSGSLRIEMRDWAKDYEYLNGGSNYLYDYEAAPVNTAANSTTNRSANTIANERIANSTDVEPDEIYGDYDKMAAYPDEFQPPSVKFERAIFVGAKMLRLFYKFDVKRARQLVMHQFDKKKVAAFDTKKTSISSEVLIFDLKPDVFGYREELEEMTTSSWENLSNASSAEEKPSTSVWKMKFENENTDNSTDAAKTATRTTPMTPTTSTTVSQRYVSSTTKGIHVNAGTRWRHLRNVFLIAMCASSVVLLALIYIYRRNVHRRICTSCYTCGCEPYDNDAANATSNSGDETKQTTVNGATIPANGTAVGQKRKKKKRRFFYGKFYQSA